MICRFLEEDYGGDRYQATPSSEERLDIDEIKAQVPLGGAWQLLPPSDMKKRFPEQDLFPMITCYFVHTLLFYRPLVFSAMKRVCRGSQGRSHCGRMGFGVRSLETSLGLSLFFATETRCSAFVSPGWNGRGKGVVHPTTIANLYGQGRAEWVSYISDGGVFNIDSSGGTPPWYTSHIVRRILQDCSVWIELVTVNDNCSTRRICSNR